MFSFKIKINLTIAKLVSTVIFKDKSLLLVFIFFRYGNIKITSGLNACEPLLLHRKTEYLW